MAMYVEEEVDMVEAEVEVIMEVGEVVVEEVVEEEDIVEVGVVVEEEGVVVVVEVVDMVEVGVEMKLGEGVAPAEIVLTGLLSAVNGDTVRLIIK